jgi:conjugative relaxase-like TrwC/TraI family protein
MCDSLNGGMLRITQQSNSASAKRCYATADYYSQGRGIFGSWGGEGASRLGLSGIVNRFSFRRLCDNLEPRTGKPVTVRMRSRRTVGYTFRFSVAKSVALLYAMSVHHDILVAFRAAVSESMREMEGEMKTRVRKAGEDTERITGNMVWAEFIHTTSCPVDGVCDPQLHAYIFVFNMTWDEQEHRWKAAVFRDIKSDAPYFQAAFRVRLANKLQDLGFEIERPRDDFEVLGIPSRALKRFSRRTELIERLARERGITNPRWKAELGPKTRERKAEQCGLGALRKEWKARLTREERQQLTSVYRRKTGFARQVSGEVLAVDQAIEHCLVPQAAVPERRLVTEALKRGIGAVTVERVTREVANRALVRSDVGGRRMVRLSCT